MQTLYLCVLLSMCLVLFYKEGKSAIKTTLGKVSTSGTCQIYIHIFYLNNSQIKLQILFFRLNPSDYNIFPCNFLYNPMIAKVFQYSAFSLIFCMSIFGSKKHIRREFIQTFFPHLSNRIGV